MFLGKCIRAEYVLNMFSIWSHCLSFLYLSSVLRTHYLFDQRSCSIFGFSGGFRIKIERGILTPFRTMNCHDGKMYNPVVTTKILPHEKNTKGWKVFLWISCIYNLMSQQDQTHELS